MLARRWRPHLDRRSDTAVDYNSVMTTDVVLCIDCAEDLEHCHGTAVVSADGSHACSDDPDCRLAVELHLLRAEAEN